MYLRIIVTNKNIHADLFLKLNVRKLKPFYKSYFPYDGQNGAQSSKGKNNEFEYNFKSNRKFTHCYKIKDVNRLEEKICYFHCTLNEMGLFFLY
jgi:hypothetical protein